MRQVWNRGENRRRAPLQPAIAAHISEEPDTGLAAVAPRPSRRARPDPDPPDARTEHRTAAHTNNASACAFLLSKSTAAASKFVTRFRVGRVLTIR
ncbi:Homeobox protein PKNOX1 [Frankliniella fusca]|uniref:Homeobox protein PKNOX1 n=1 Tax=Frankliniella fusca TaxID=407009 RepID=A0AAE1LC42_9NEOP|nr:Homeobox protein PKNOX1 [Frankliniella fusca]